MTNWQLFGGLDPERLDNLPLFLNVCIFSFPIVVFFLLLLLFCTWQYSRRTLRPFVAQYLPIFTIAQGEGLKNVEGMDDESKFIVI